MLVNDRQVRNPQIDAAGVPAMGEAAPRPYSATPFARVVSPSPAKRGMGLGRGGRSSNLGAWAVVLALLALALSVTPSPVSANGTPIRIVLSYLNGVSNFGPPNATGVSELITSEGEVRLTAAGLQKLGDTEEYQLWISAGEGGQKLRLGTVQVNDAGVGRLDTVLKQPIPELPWDQMTLTVEPKGAQAAAPSEKRSISGRFTMNAASGSAPRVLPNT